MPIDLAAERSQRALFPRIIPDGAGGIHVFWDEILDVEGGQRIWVAYRYWNGVQWSAPLDVFIGSARGSASGAQAAIDAKGTMHTIWRDERGIMYARRHVHSPVSATSWAERQWLLQGTPGLGHLQIELDEEGTLHVVAQGTYSQGLGVYYLRSNDGGERWTAPLFLAGSEEAVEGRYRLSMVLKGRTVHVAWQEQGGVGYVKSLDSGNGWATPIHLEEMGSWPRLVALQDSRLLLLTVGTIEDAFCVKLQTTSANDGESWLPTEVLFLPVRGCLGNSSVVRDSQGNPHLVMSAYLEGTFAEQIWHSTWSAKGWLPAELLEWQQLPYELFGEQVDFPDAAITGGNVLHAVFMVDEGRVWYTRKELPVPSLTVTSYPRPTVAPTQTSALNSAPALEATLAAPTLVATRPADTYSSMIYLFPAASALAVVCGLLIWWRRR